MENNNKDNDTETEILLWHMGILQRNYQHHLHVGVPRECFLSCIIFEWLLWGYGGECKENGHYCM